MASGSSYCRASSSPIEMAVAIISGGPATIFVVMAFTGWNCRASSAVVIMKMIIIYTGTAAIVMHMISTLAVISHIINSFSGNSLHYFTQERVNMFNFFTGFGIK